jgi:hypothetical protein
MDFGLMVFHPCFIIPMALVIFEFNLYILNDLLDIGHRFSGSYDEYFGLATDTDSFNYLQLANYVSQTLFPQSITIAEVYFKRKHHL